MVSLHTWPQWLAAIALLLGIAAVAGYFVWSLASDPNMAKGVRHSHRAGKPCTCVRCRFGDNEPKHYKPGDYTAGDYYVPRHAAADPLAVPQQLVGVVPEPAGNGRTAGTARNVDPSPAPRTVPELHGSNALVAWSAVAESAPGA